VTKRKKNWLVGILTVLLIATIGAIIAARIAVARFEPMLREQAIRYLHERFHSDVELTSLHIVPPKMSTMDILLRKGRGALVSVEGEGLSMRFGGARDLPPLFSIRKLQFTVDLGILSDQRKTVEFVAFQGMQIHIPPRGARPHLGNPDSKRESERPDVVIKNVEIRDAVLVLLPREANKKPLKFDIQRLQLKSVGLNTPMKYDAAMTIPKPPGTLHSHGDFGPWAGPEPGDTPLQGDYVFENADLGIFNAIAGTLRSTGTFRGTLDSVEAKGYASVPNFRLKMAGNPIPLSTQFEVLVDGTNGDTVLRPVRARLGRTNFTTTGAVIKHEIRDHRAINLKVTMPSGDIRDLLRLATKGPPLMEGVINLKSAIDIPPLTGKVKEKLLLDGDFDLKDAKFLRSTIQDQIDQLSRRGQGQPKNEAIDEVVSNMKGSFHLENQVMTFRALSFEVPGAAVALAGNYDLDQDVIDFHGTLKLDAKISQTMTGWKRIILKPADPFFAKNGAGTFLHIKVDGTSRQPKFGLDRKHSDKALESEPPPKASGGTASK
jgi:AsmA-like protein